MMTGGVQPLTHEQAEMLISARMDQQLERAESRALLVHLQTCESCRAFAVQAEVLGRELSALPMLPASPMVDRQLREIFAKGHRRWPWSGLLVPTGSGSGVRAAAGALAVLTLISIYLLVRMAGGGGGDRTIDAPNGGVAQQLESTVTVGAGVVGQSVEPTATARVLMPPPMQTPDLEPTDSAQIAQAVRTATEIVESESIAPTATLDSNYVYPAASNKTPRSEVVETTPTAQATALPVPTEVGEVAVASFDEAEPVAETSGAMATPETGTDISGEEATAEPDNVSSVASEESTIAVADVAMEENDVSPQPEPPVTHTPVEIATDTTPAPVESPVAAENVEDTSEPVPTGATAVESPQGDGTDIDTASAIATDEPTMTPGEPFLQPTIAPSGRGSNQNEAEGTGEQASEDAAVESASTGDSPQIEPNDGSSTQPSAVSGDGSGGSPQIVPVGSGSELHDNEPAYGAAETGIGGEMPARGPMAIPTANPSAQPMGLDFSDVVATFQAGTSSPLGPLQFSPSLELFAIFTPDGQLAVADRTGDVVIMLGAGDSPVWSGNALMFSTPGNAGTMVGIWDSDSGNLSYVRSTTDESISDIPIGGGGTNFYFQRLFPDRPGAMEIHNASIDGADLGALWESDSVMQGGVQPAISDAGILLPTDTSWVLIDFDGNETRLGDNPYGYVGIPVLSPGGGLVAYSAGNQVIVAWTSDPGVAVATAPFEGSTGGYAFAITGEQVVVSDGTALHVVSYEGDDLGTLAGTQPIGGVIWIDDTIYYLQIGADAALRSTSLEAVQAS